MNGIVELTRTERGRHEAEQGEIESLLRTARPLVYRWALIRTGDPDEAEDIAQAVLLRVHAGLHNFQGRSRFTTWLYRITANTAAERERQRGVLQRLRERWSRRERAVTWTETDPVAALESARVRRLIETLLTELSTMQRAALDLVDLQGFSPTEAAAMLGIRPGTLRVNLLRARRRLRRRLLEEQVTRTTE